MEDIEIKELQRITREANNVELFSEVRYPYLDAYKELNNEITDRAKNGFDFIEFDFVERPDISFDQEKYRDVIHSCFRIYSSTNSNALYDVFHYPNYLLGKGFKIDIGKATKRQGYKTKSYRISW